MGDESKELLYPSMSLQEIEAVPVKELSDENAHLYLWTINKYIQESYDIARSWGFEPSCLLTWIKPPHGIGLGGTFIQTTEHLLFCRKGTLEAKKRIDTTWFKYPRGKHSEKPEEFRKMIEEVSPGSRIELFARQKLKGWESWGNEI
jgi:N6-adenosine-specific RNA methylase IME4